MESLCCYIFKFNLIIFLLTTPQSVIRFLTFLSIRIDTPLFACRSFVCECICQLFHCYVLSFLFLLKQQSGSAVFLTHEQFPLTFLCSPRNLRCRDSYSALFAIVGVCLIRPYARGWFLASLHLNCFSVKWGGGPLSPPSTWRTRKISVRTFYRLPICSNFQALETRPLPSSVCYLTYTHSTNSIAYWSRWGRGSKLKKLWAFLEVWLWQSDTLCNPETQYRPFDFFDKDIRIFHIVSCL